MTSSRTLESNKKNASLSTGPRSQRGKLRSKMNARRHGLATRLDDIPEQSSRLERLASILAEGGNSLGAGESRVIAESYLDMQRIRATLHGMLREIFKAQTPEDLKAQLSEIEKIDRYRRRAASRRKTAFKGLTLNKEACQFVQQDQG
jgi:hypothetical protein